MGIRDTSYYNWKVIDNYSTTLNIKDSRYNAVAVDVSGNIYLTGYQSGSTGYEWLTRKSSDNGRTFQNIDVYTTASDGFTATKNITTFGRSILIDNSGAIYVVGQVSGSNVCGVIRKSHMTASTSWTKIANFYPAASGECSVADIAIDSTGSLFCVGYSSSFGLTVNDKAWITRKSTDRGSTWQIVDSKLDTRSNLDLDGPRGVIVRSDDKIFVCGMSSSINWLVRSSSDSGSTWATVDRWQGQNGGSNALGYAYELTVDNNGVVYVIGTSDRNNIGTSFSPQEASRYTIRSSSLGATGTWGTFDDYQTAGILFGDDIQGDIGRSIITIDNLVYSVGYANNQFSTNAIMRRGVSGTYGGVNIIDESASFVLPQTFNDLMRFYSITSDSLKNIYIAGYAKNNAICLKGELTANSASLGPRMLCTSFSYLTEFSGNTTEHFKLNNVSEFPHSSGLFQMPSMVLGTKSSGRAGKTDDSIVQKRFIGSFVRVMYPKQEESDIRGYDAARKPGKLSTNWAFGEVVNVEGKNFDHLALNCSVAKQVSGTLDSILIRVETKPLNDSGFLIDQTTELTISSSYSSETIYRDEIHRKDIDYGDLSISEISWKIPIDLKNVKEIRIAAKQKNGQDDDKNKLLLVVGRFITENKQHNET